jgi:hypothetical protein
MSAKVTLGKTLSNGIFSVLFASFEEVICGIHFDLPLTIIELQVVISSNPILVSPFCQRNFLGLTEILTRQQSFIAYVNSYG